MSSPTDSSLHLLLTEREVETTRELELAKARVEELAEHIKRFEAEIDPTQRGELETVRLRRRRMRQPEALVRPAAARPRPAHGVVAL